MFLSSLLLTALLIISFAIESFLFFLRQSFVLNFTDLETWSFVGADFLSSSDPTLFSWLFTDDDLNEKSDSAGLKDGVKLTSVILSPDGRWAEGLLNPAEVSTSREFSVDDS